MYSRPAYGLVELKPVSYATEMPGPTPRTGETAGGVRPLGGGAIGYDWFTPPRVVLNPVATCWPAVTIAVVGLVGVSNPLRGSFTMSKVNSRPQRARNCGGMLVPWLPKSVMTSCHCPLTSAGVSP